MKRYIAFLTIVLAVAASCAKQPAGEKYLAAPALQTSTGTVSFEAEGGSTFVSVSTLETVVAKANKDWVDVSVSGKQVNLSVPANESIETRYALIDITAGGKSRSIQVIQFGVNTKLVWEDEYEFPFEGGSLSLLYQTNATIRLSVDGDWISASTADGVLDITVAKNPLKEEREGSIVWKAGEEQRTIAIKQAANPSGDSGDNPGGGDDPDGVIFSEDFEDINTLGDWVLYDADGDDFYWMYDNSETLSAHSGVGKLISESYDNEAQEPLNPDNWVFTSAIKLASSDNYLSFWVVPQDGAYPKEHYAAYVTTTDPSDASVFDNCTMVVEGTLTQGYQTSGVGPTAVGTWENPIAKIPDEFNGQTVYIGFRHFDCSDWFILNLDDILVTKGEPTASAASLFCAPSATDKNLFITRK